MSPLRRSGRQRAPNHRFAEDASRLLEELDPGAEDEQAEEEAGPSNAAGAPFPDVDNNPESASDMAFDESGESEASSPEVASADSDGADIDMSDVSSPARVSRRKKLKLTSQAKRNSADVLHNRGLGVSYNKINRIEEVVQMLAGSDLRDQQRLKSTIQYWYNDVSLPSREYIAWDASEDGLLTAIAARPEAGDVDPWAWYDQPTVREAIRELQPTHRITPVKAQAYYPARLPMHKVVMGPHWQQTLFELRLGEPLHLAKAWKLALDSDAEDFAPTGPSIELERNGWIINLGAKIQSLAWAPNRDEDTQYLAVALDQPDPKRSARQSAFEPTRNHKSSIQIWRFQAREADDIPKGLDPTKEPVLAKIICTEWGMCKEIKWCPVPRCSNNETDKKSHLGLMATVWSDGYVRVLDVAISGIEGNGMWRHSSP
jgi:transcription factor C subunit 6